MSLEQTETIPSVMQLEVGGRPEFAPGAGENADSLYYIEVVKALSGPIAFVIATLLLLPFAVNGLAELSRFREPMPCDCFGSKDARLRIVYLHGLDTAGPSWLERQNRDRLRVIAGRLGARIALPRIRGAWPQRDEAGLKQSMRVIDGAAAECFGSGQRYGLIGFSNGGNLANQLFISSRAASMSWVLSIASLGTAPRAGDAFRGRHIRVIAGRSDPTLGESAAFVRQLAARGADARLIEHDGGHELPFQETLGAVAELADAHSH